MSLSAQEIAAEISTLPEQEQQEVVDFVEFLKAKLIRRQAKRFFENQESQTNQQTVGEPALLQVPDKKGLLDCAGGDGLLSEDYKQHSATKQKDVSPIYQAFEQAGLIGCIETDEQLSTTYKEKLDFSFKHGGAE